MSRGFKPYFCLLGLVVLLASCAPQLFQRRPIPSINDDLDVESLRAAIRQSISYLQNSATERIVGEEPIRLTAADVLASLQAFEALLVDWRCGTCFRRALEARFELIPSSADPQQVEVLFTGYYQPEIDGSLVKTDVYRYPIYGYPADLVRADAGENGGTALGRIDQDKFVPYYSRQEIDQLGLLQGRGLEIAWVKDPIELFFLHIQGSGLLHLPDGSTLGVGYAGQNGWPYRSIGRLLIDNGKLTKEEMSMQRLRRYLNENPNEQRHLRVQSELCVFSRGAERAAWQSGSSGDAAKDHRNRFAPVWQRRFGFDSNRTADHRQRWRVSRLAAGDAVRTQSRYRRRHSRSATRRLLLRQR